MKCYRPHSKSKCGVKIQRCIKLGHWMKLTKKPSWVHPNKQVQSEILGRMKINVLETIVNVRLVLRNVKMSFYGVIFYLFGNIIYWRFKIVLVWYLKVCWFRKPVLKKVKKKDILTTSNLWFQNWPSLGSFPCWNVVMSHPLKWKIWVQPHLMNQPRNRMKNWRNFAKSIPGLTF